MREIACSLSGIMSMILAETVAHVDQPWEMDHGDWVLIRWALVPESIPHVPEVMH